MKLTLLVLLLCFIGCKSSNQVKDLIKGNWQLASNNNYFSIKITINQYTVENDSSIPEDYWITGDSIIVKGFEADSGGSVDSMKIIRLT